MRADACRFPHSFGCCRRAHRDWHRMLSPRDATTGRSPEIYEAKGNVWTDAESQAVSTPGMYAHTTLACGSHRFARAPRGFNSANVRTDGISGRPCDH
jgi:hypothetical protein